MVSGFDVEMHVNYYCNLNYLIVIVIIIFCLLIVHDMSLYLSVQLLTRVKYELTSGI